MDDRSDRYVDDITDGMWVDRRVRDTSGDVLGVVVDVYEDPHTRRPTWLAISTGYFGTCVAVVPIRGASLLGDEVVVAHNRETITEAPAVEIFVAVTPDHHRQLVDHYGPSRSH